MAERRTRAARQPRPGSKFLSQVFGDNLRGERTRQNMQQDTIAERMVELGHEGWSRATVSNVERARRVVSLDEVLALCAVVGVPPTEMLDPRSDRVDFGPTEEPPFPGPFVREWLRGRVRIRWRHQGEKNHWFMENLEDLTGQQLGELLAPWTEWDR